MRTKINNGLRLFNYSKGLFCVFLLKCIIVILLFVKTGECEVTRRFPSDFEWGVGSSAYQIEGAWNESGKGESILDHIIHNYPQLIKDLSNGDITADSYHNWRRDVEMIKELGVKIYRFSLSWPRILPTGFMNNVNMRGIRYYNNLIDELVKNNITPMVTLYHWDLPQKLQELGGWSNPEVIHHFQNLARIAFEQFGDRVKIWTTINEPRYLCEQALNYPDIPSYLCIHNVLKAHAEVVHMYRNQFQTKQQGKIGISSDSPYPQPLSNSVDDQEASEIALQFHIGWYAHPIFSKTGNYPQIVIDRIGALSKEQGLSKSRLPVFTQKEIDRIRGTSDFFGLNSYTTVLVQKNDHNNSANYTIPSFNYDMGVVESYDIKWTGSASVWLHVVPDGMYKLLQWIRKEYDNPPIYITENGVSDNGGTNDTTRIDYFNLYLTAVLDAIEDGCNVVGYIAWSLMDCFEWRAGFTETFGLYHVDFTSKNRTRTPKASAKVYRNIVKTHHIDWNYRPEPDILIKASRQMYDNGDKSFRVKLHSFYSIFIILLICILNQLYNILKKNVNNKINYFNKTKRYLKKQ